MPDPAFESFQQPIGVLPPDPREIRRRGDRRSRRTAIATVVGAAAVVAAVVAPVAALTSDNDRPTPPSNTTTPTPSPTPSGLWKLSIPDDFPLGDGIPMPGEASAGMQRGKGSAVPPCGDTVSSLGQSAGWTDVATATNADVVDAVDGTDSRVLALYANGADAKQVLASIAQMYDACPPGQPGVGPEVAQRIGDGNAWVLTLVATDLPVGQIVTVERVGNALLVQHDSLKVSYPGGTDAQLADIRGGQKHVVAAMCIFAADPCAGPPPAAQTSTPGSDDPVSGEPSVAHVDEIPADFPIDAAHEDPGSDGEVHPPSDEGDPVLFDPCGLEAFAVPSQDRIFFQVVGPEYGDTRELRTYPSAGDAVRQMERLRSAVSGCPTDPSSDPGGAAIWDTHTVDTGYDSFAAAQTYEQGLGGGVWVFTRVGRSILAMVEGGEFSRDSAWDRLPNMLDRTRRITPSMCLFTDAGC